MTGTTSIEQNAMWCEQVDKLNERIAELEGMRKDLIDWNLKLGNDVERLKTILVGVSDIAQYSTGQCQCVDLRTYCFNKGIDDLADQQAKEVK